MAMIRKVIAIFLLNFGISHILDRIMGDNEGENYGPIYKVYFGRERN